MEVDQDDYRAFVWYLKAAYLGNDVAQRKVSRLIYNQPSRSTAAPEAVLGDAVKTAQVEPAAIVSLVETRIKRQATVKEIFSEVPLEKPTEVLDTPASVASETVWEESSNSSDDDVFVDLEPIDSSEDGSSDKDDNASHGNPNNNFTYGINSYSSHSGYACDHCHNASSTTTINIARAPQTLRGSDTATFTSAQHSSIKVGRRAPQMDTNDITLTLTNAGHGDTEAQVRMGDMFLQMNDPSHDEQAVQWFFKAAIRGDSRGQHRIADMFMKGRGGVPVDYSAAMHWYLEAAEQGDVGAQRQAAMLYTKNLKHSMDDSMAVKWFLKHRHYRYAHVGSNRYRENI
ncbi:hypothetical protein BGW39_007024 [Mortierella sp. 14UC]|nr:hypothetical protein BGW39_007024 [Mortierella sp. 14UC]